jgi:hypothetical protein
MFPDPKTTDTALPFILQLRCICETIFDIMLSAYVSALNAYHDRSASTGKHMKGPSLDGWDQALESAKDALATFRKAGTQRKDGSVDSADLSVLEGLRLLHERYRLHQPSHSVCSYSVSVQKLCRRVQV